MNNYNIEGVIKKDNLDIAFKYNHIENCHATIVAIGGTGGGFNGPANIYDYLSVNLEIMNLSLLRINVFPDYLEGVENVKVGLEFLNRQNTNKDVILIGWSMGGATMIHIAKYIQDTEIFKVKNLIILAGQSLGSDPIKELNDIPVTIIHGTADKCLDVEVGHYLYRIANSPKRLVLLDGAGHWMSEQFDKLVESINESIDMKLNKYAIKSVQIC